MIDNLATATNQYAKRQLTWFKRDKNIIWLDTSNKNNLYKQTTKIVKEFLNKKEKN